MLRGKGKYDALLTEAREKADAFGGVLMIIDGNKGGGFSVQATQEILIQLPDMLENIAKSLRSDLNQSNKGDK